MKFSDILQGLSAETYLAKAALGDERNLKVSGIARNVQVSGIACNVQVSGIACNVQVSGIARNAKQVKKNWIYVCIEGASYDGHDFARQAYENGALAIFTQKDLGLENQIIVPSTREAWAILSANWFENPARKLKIIGVTGTNGKTSVVFFIKSMLEALGEKVGIMGTIQNMIGDEILPATQTTPDAYDIHYMLSEMANRGCSYVVIEVSSHALDQHRVTGLTFEAGVFTNLSQDHLDYHKTMGDYYLAKRRLFEISKNAVVNLDDEWFSKGLDNLSCKVITYSALRDDSDYTAKNIKLNSGGVSYEYVAKGHIGRIKAPVPGMFTVYNTMAAAAAVISLGFSFEDVLSAALGLKGVKGRVEVVHSSAEDNLDFTVIIDYAHTPDSIEKACETIKASTNKGRLVTLFGCGGDRDKTKRPLMAAAAAKKSDFIIVTSDNPRSEDPSAIIEDILEGFNGLDKPGNKYKVIVDRREAIRWAIKNAETNDTLLIAGKGHESYQILKDGAVAFDEEEIVKEAVEAKKNNQKL